MPQDSIDPNLIHAASVFLHSLHEMNEAGKIPRKVGISFVVAIRHHTSCVSWVGHASKHSLQGISGAHKGPLFLLRTAILRPLVQYTSSYLDLKPITM